MHTCTLEQKSSFKKLQFFILFDRVTCSKTLAKLWVKTLATINKVLLCPNYIDMQNNYDNMQDHFIYMLLKLCYVSK